MAVNLELQCLSSGKYDMIVIITFCCLSYLKINDMLKKGKICRFMYLLPCLVPGCKDMLHYCKPKKGTHWNVFESFQKQNKADELGFKSAKFQAQKLTSFVRGRESLHL